MSYRGLNAYRRTEVQSRTSLELVVMLYDGALRFLAQARDAMTRGDIRARQAATSRLLAIISELQSTLDLERGGEIATNLDALYTYMTERVLAGTGAGDPAAIDEVRRLLENLRDGWQAIAQQQAAGAMVAAGAGQPSPLAEMAR
jgi:flagellar protein FliS